MTFVKLKHNKHTLNNSALQLQTHSKQQCITAANTL